MCHPLNPHLLSLLVPFFIALLAAAQSNNPSIPKCRKYYCGNVTISYPFWNIDTESTSQFCGYEGFGINCSTIGNRSIPEIALGGDYYYVQRINYESSKFVLADYDVSSTSPNNCPLVRHGINLQTLPLNFTTLDVNLSFHFNCNGCPFDTEIPCMERNEIRSCVQVMDTSTAELSWDVYSCRQEVVTTVLRDNIIRYSNLPTDFRSVLAGGFELEWSTMDGCDKCEVSGGQCGHHNTTGLICFCVDGSTRNGHCEGTFGSSLNLKFKMVIGFGSAALSIMTLIVLFFIWKPSSCQCVASLKRRTEEHKKIEAFIKHYGSSSTQRYKYNDIKKMTNSFKVKLGQGGFGQVFKGTLLDGRLVAVKVLTSTKANGEEFINEVASIGRTSHVNIVTLLGFCFDDKKRALVYEYMPNGSLEKYIYSRTHTGTNEHIGVEKMYEIALGIASGLNYLHRGCNTRILHLDIKPHNILLDEDLHPKIADFGLAKLYSRKKSIVSMLEARGTIGYIAPEVYNKNFGGVSHKSDVYSYGMLLLEMAVGGRKNVDVGVVSGCTSEIYFPDWIYSRLQKNDFLLDAIATTEENDYVRKMTIVGLWCIQPPPNQRPTINEVIEMLEGSMETLEVPPQPFFSSPPRSPATIYSTSVSIQEAS